ncbi:MAG: DUF4139 domain-containing protein [Planctomycetota bacterium]|jgi:hypothetical protein
MRLLTALAVSILVTTSARAEIGLTVYSSADPAGFDPQAYVAQQRQGYNPTYARQVPGFGVVRDVRPMTLRAGVNTIDLTDVAAFIDPTTVTFNDLTNPNATQVLEQRFLFDLVSPDKLLDKYIDAQITVRVPVSDTQVENITGTLLSNNQGQLVIQTGDGLRIVNRGQGQVQLPKLPGGLMTRPTLRWMVNTPQAGQRDVRTTYQTNGLSWKSDYNLVLNDDDTEADLGAWVTLINLSGASYPDAKLKLVAGDVGRVQPQVRARVAYAAAELAMKADTQGFEEKAFFEYHMYTLPRTTTVNQNATQQIALFPTVSGVGVEKLLVLDASPRARYSYEPYRTSSFQRNSGRLSVAGGKITAGPALKTDVYIKFDNKEANRLGLPLPRGKVRVYKQDSTQTGGDDAIEFIGEDLIDHTPANETVLIKIGQAFDVVANRTTTDFRVDTAAKTMTESFRIEVRNAKPVNQKVLVIERLYRWKNWRIIRNTEDYEKANADTIHFEVDVPAGGSKVIEYTVRYTW